MSKNQACPTPEKFKSKGTCRDPDHYFKKVKAALADRDITEIGYSDMQGLIAQAELMEGTEAQQFSRQMLPIYAEVLTPRFTAEKLVRLVESCVTAKKPAPEPPQSPPAPVLNAKLTDDLGLDEAISNSLKAQGLDTAGKIKNFTLSGQRLDEIPGIDKTTAEKIELAVEVRMKQGKSESAWEPRDAIIPSNGIEHSSPGVRQYDTGTLGLQCRQMIQSNPSAFKPTVARLTAEDEFLTPEIDSDPPEGAEEALKALGTVEGKLEAKQQLGPDCARLLNAWQDIRSTYWKDSGQPFPAGIKDDDARMLILLGALLYAMDYKGRDVGLVWKYRDDWGLKGGDPVRFFDGRKFARQLIDDGQDTEKICISIAKALMKFGQPEHTGKPAVISPEAKTATTSLCAATEPVVGEEQAPDTPQAGGEVSNGAPTSCSDLAKTHNLDPEKLRKRLERERTKNDGCYIEMGDTNRTPREPKYLYRPEKIQHILDDLGRSKTSGERPAK